MQQSYQQTPKAFFLERIIGTFTGDLLEEVAPTTFDWALNKLHGKQSIVSNNKNNKLIGCNIVILLTADNSFLCF